MASMWELDTRPTQPCVVCWGIPDRTVALPQLPDVHVAFGSSAICRDCADLGAANAPVELMRRAEAGWADDGIESVPDLVRLVLAAFGHKPPPAQVAPEEVRHWVLEALSAADEVLWQRLEPLIRDSPPGNVICVHGTIEYSIEGSEPTTIDVFRDGPKVRLADADGRPWLLCDGESVWQRDRKSDSDAMFVSAYTGQDRWGGEGADLAARRTREDVELFGFGSPIGPIESIRFLGRPAWKFRFAAPPHKPYDMAVIIDDETGLTLEKRFGDHSLARWTSFGSAVDVAQDLFVWRGLTVDLEQERREEREQHEDCQARQAAWFTANVTTAPLQVRGDAVEVMLHVREDDGSFEATLGGPIDGALARRPRSDQWWNLGWSEVTHRWTDDAWDWALSEFSDEAPRLSADQLTDLKRAFRSG